MKLKSNRSYLLKAIRDWLNDQGKTPYLIANVEHDGVSVPEGFAMQNNQICLDISTDMVRDFNLVETELSFKAQFKGKVHVIKLPLSSLQAISCKENSWGILFSMFDGNDKVDLPKDPPKFKIEDD